MYYNSSDMTCVLMSDLIKDWNKPLKILKSIWRIFGKFYLLHFFNQWQDSRQVNYDLIGWNLALDWPRISLYWTAKSSFFLQDLPNKGSNFILSLLNRSWSLSCANTAIFWQITWNYRFRPLSTVVFPRIVSFLE